jgi:hypothetical protein
VLLAEIAQFLPTAICVFGRHWLRICKLARGIVDEWITVQRPAMDTGSQIAARIDPEEREYTAPHIALLLLGFHDALLRSFVTICDCHKNKGADHPHGFSMMVPSGQPRFAALFDVNAFIKELASDNSKARLPAVMVLG